MARNKSKDDTYFNCSEEHEFIYVSNLYGDNKNKVYDYLKKKCEDNSINYTAHIKVYRMIESDFGYSIPL